MRSLFLLLFIGLSSCQNCEDGWDYHDSFCYYVAPIEKETAWNSAETQCQNMNANLLSVANNAEYEAILNMRSVKDANAWLWIGLHRLSGSSKDNFEWTDGTPYKEISYRPNGLREVSVWPEGGPTDKDGYDCARLRMIASDPPEKRENQGTFGPGDNNRPDRTKDGQWELRRCGSTTIRHPYICKKPSNQDPILCQNGFEPKAGSCWKILNEEKYSYENAKKVCRSDHKSYLAEILNDEEQQGWNLIEL